ncbi:MAG: hexose kinase, partial [Clostridia bacterium]|nr:hexose kinase [Clostridia bacterium]
NVAVMLSRLGQKATALGFAAGFTGCELVRLVEDSGVRADFIRLNEGLTRINVKVQGAQETEINGAGPCVTAAAWQELLTRVDKLVSGDTLVLSGSVAGGMDTTAYAEILARLQGRGIRTVVDATRDLLRNTLPYHPFLIKPNRQELEELAGRPLCDDEDILAAAQQLQAAGAQNVLVSLGERGALLLDEQGAVYRRAAIPVTVADTVGAGDSMIAGFLAGLTDGVEAALNLAVAAGSATAAADGLATGKAVLDLVR